MYCVGDCSFVSYNRCNIMFQQISVYPLPHAIADDHIAILDIIDHRLMR